MQDVKLVNDLQQLDWKTADAEKRLAEVRAELADDLAIASARQELDELDALLEEVTLKRRAGDGSVSELQTKLQQLDAKLYGGLIKNPREVTAAEEERAFLEGQQREQEDALLELMVSIEEAEPQRKDAQEALNKLETSRPEEEMELRAEEERLQREISSLAEERELLAPSVGSKLLSTYESLRATKNGHAVARVERGMCQGCRLALSTMELQRARSTQEFVQCSSCRRILYLG